MTELIGNMGNKTNTPNHPLTCVLKNFDRFYSPIIKEDYNYPTIKHHLPTFCETERRTLMLIDPPSVLPILREPGQWLMSSSVSLATGIRLDTSFFRLKQFPAYPHPFIKACMVHNGQGGQALVINIQAFRGPVAETNKPPLKTILQNLQKEESLLPPCNYLHPLLPSSPQPPSLPP